MFKFRHRGADRRSPETNVDKLLRILGDERWHSTAELVSRVGHTFAHAKFKAMRYGYPVEKRKHPQKSRQYQYRIHATPGLPEFD